MMINDYLNGVLASLSGWRCLSFRRHNGILSGLHPNGRYIDEPPTFAWRVIRGKA